jgi:hypothetical protein
VISQAFPKHHKRKKRAETKRRLGDVDARAENVYGNVGTLISELPSLKMLFRLRMRAAAAKLT